MHGIMMDNFTNDRTSKYAKGLQVPITFQYAHLASGIIITALSILTIHILWKCRKLTNQIRLMSMHMTVANLLYGITKIVNFVYGKVIRNRCPVVLKMIPIAFVIYNVFLAAAGMDRLLSLQFSLKYKLWQSERKTRIFIVVLYLLGICANIPNLIMKCPVNDIDMFTYNGLVCVVCTALFLTLWDVIIYSYIGVIALKTRISDRNRTIAIGERSDYARVWLATMKSFALMVLTVLFLGPYVVVRAIDIFYNENADMTDRSLVFGLLHVFHQIVSPIFILASYKECRYHVAVLCCFCCKRKRQNIERDYQQHYATFIISTAPVAMDNSQGIQ